MREINRSMLSFSVVINTLNRASLLSKTLESLRWITYPGVFEVIVVNGPSTDETDQVINAWLPKIKAGSCNLANLSVSRNIGICMARGDIVVFIDDDAIPEPEWLTQLAAAYDCEEVGGAGGLVFDPSGYSYQYEYSTGNRLGNANWQSGASGEHFCFPSSFEFPYLQGTNASFRRSALLEVGGFDEEIEYYLDETELCCRLIDAGYVIRQLPHAYVHHKFAPSHVRDEHKITRYRYPVLKNKLYFSLKHAQPYYSLSDIFDDGCKFFRMHAADVDFHIVGGRLPESERERFLEESNRAWERGVAQGLSQNYQYITPVKQASFGSEFLEFPVLGHQESKSVVLISRDFPPGHSGGIATFKKDLAEALAAMGNLVHVITQSPDFNRVDFEQGVWVHRIVTREISRSQQAIDRKIPQHVWNWSATALEETQRIATHRSVDVVEAPIWDCEGAAFLLDPIWPLVTSLHTTLHFWMESHPEFGHDRTWQENFGKPMLALERELMTCSHAVRANSKAIIHAIEQSYDFNFDTDAVKVIAHGLAPLALKSHTSDHSTLEILFVGRLEPRKGIDVLLASIPSVLAQAPHARLRIIGDDTLQGPSGSTFKAKFLADYDGQSWLEKVSFEGRVEQEILLDAYNRCDIFVAPSRFESFGLVLLEAMRVGKPVVACMAGGMPEVVRDGVSGFLVEPGNAEELSRAVIRLANDQALRDQLGQAGRQIFEEKFTAKRMADDSMTLYDIAGKNFSQKHPA